MFKTINDSIPFLIKQFINFGIVGLLNTGIYFAVYYILLLFFNMNYIFAYSISFVISVLNAYYLNSKYVFKKNTKEYIRPLLKTFCVYGSTFILSVGLLIFMVYYVNISKIFAPVINLLVVAPLSFLLNKFWTFK